jgi:peptidoglycan/xylan/chitin deacetylase (PgdA/CDA1 family)
MYFIETPAIIKYLYPSYTWNINDGTQSVYITFDDGPHPDSTPVILDILKSNNAKATFFCSGEKAKLNPGIIAEIIENDHSPGNHAFSHINGWRAGKKAYIENVKACNEFVNSKLFRPPYGRITNAQKKELQLQYQIVMWSLMPGDFDIKVNKEKCLERSIRYTKPGTIIVLHDSINTIEKLQYILPKYIQHFNKKGYTFKSLNSEIIK